MSKNGTDSVKFDYEHELRKLQIELLKFQKRKRFCVVIICEDANPARFWDKSFVKLAQPYTYDVLRAAINECLKRRSLAASDAAK